MLFKRDGLGIFLKQIAALISEPILVPQTAADQPSQLTPIFKLDFGDNDFEMSPFFFLWKTWSMVIIKLQNQISVFEIPTALLDKQTLKTFKWQYSFVVFSNYMCRQQHIQHWTTVETLLK